MLREECSLYAIYISYIARFNPYIVQYEDVWATIVWLSRPFFLKIPSLMDCRPISKQLYRSVCS